MTQLTPGQVHELLATVAQTVPDAMTCDQCFELLAVLADSDVTGRKPAVSLEAVTTHLKQCPCCAYEYETLLESLETTGQDGVPKVECGTL
jgi:hypothetical protein